MVETIMKKDLSMPTQRINSKLVSFLYDLMRDKIVCGEVELLVRDAEKYPDVIFTNGWLANYAKNLAYRLETKMDFDKNKTYLENLAHYYWVRDGKPNGEEYRDHPKFGRMKIKEIHWREAEEDMEIYYNHNAGGDW